MGVRSRFRALGWQNFDPAAGSKGLPRLIAKWDARYGVYKDHGMTQLAGNGDVVNAWQDLSGNGLHLKQVAAPGLTYNPTGLNGKPCLLSDGNTTYNQTDPTMTLRGKFTILGVLWGSDYGHIFLHGAGNYGGTDQGVRVYSSYAQDGSGYQSIDAHFYGYESANIANGNLWLAAYTTGVILRARSDGSATGLGIWANGVQKTPAGSGVQLYNPANQTLSTHTDTFILGGIFNGYILTGKYQYLAIYDDYIDDATCVQQEALLNSIWGVH